MVKTASDPADRTTAMFPVTATHQGWRLDAFVRLQLPALSRRLLNELFAAGRVHHNGLPARKGDPVVPGALVSVAVPAEDRATPNAGLPLQVLYETDFVVVVEKPPGQPTAPLSGEETHALANALVARYPEMSTIGHSAREPGLVHRLDNDTSGLLLAARTPAAFELLSRALREGRLEKRYSAIVPKPHFDTESITTQLGPDANPRRVTTRPKKGASYRTDVRVVRCHGALALLDVCVGPAYRHQIRAHLADCGFPLVGDTLYGSQIPHPRHALHATLLSFAGEPPVDRFRVESPLPTDLTALLAAAT